MNTETTANKPPSAMETIKDKASHLVHKVTGKPHHPTTNTTANTRNEIQPIDNLNATDNTRRGHNRGDNTGALHTDTGIPHGNPADRATYQQVSEAPTYAVPVTDQEYRNQNAQPATARLAPETTHRQGVPISSDQQRNMNTLGNAQYPSAPAAQAGPTGTSHVPTYTQNVAPMAAGVVPTTYIAETAPKNTNFPANTHNLRQSAPIHSNNGTSATNVASTVPAMGAPGTTTAAGTHVPGERIVTTETTQIPGHHHHPGPNIAGAYPNEKL
ncbi:hypothetical protein BGZ49_002964 [Haplosporangium sp. Z 27]|nr:hypothetical protein BGZ49_002964 [Haplosporangium sp. Z 27]